MTPPAAEELLEVIMSEDFVERRRKLDRWAKRWISTAMVNYEVAIPENHDPAIDEDLHKFFKGKLCESLAKALYADTQRSRLTIENSPGKREYTLNLYVIRQEPYESAAAVRPTKS